MSYYKKYLKYKQKYLELKNQIGGLTQLKINITNGVVKPLENGSINDLDLSYGRYKLKELVSSQAFDEPESNLCKINFGQNHEIQIIRFSDADSISKINKEIQFKDLDNHDYIIYQVPYKELRLDDYIDHHMEKFKRYPKAMARHYMQLKKELSECKAKLKGDSPRSTDESPRSTDESRKPIIFDFTDL